MIQLQEVNVAYRSEGPSRRGNVLSNPPSQFRRENAWVSVAEWHRKSTLMKLWRLVASFQEITIDGCHCAVNSARSDGRSATCSKTLTTRSSPRPLKTKSFSTKIRIPCRGDRRKAERSTIPADLSHKRKEDPTTLSDGENRSCCSPPSWRWTRHFWTSYSLLDLLQPNCFEGPAHANEGNRPVRLIKRELMGAIESPLDKEAVALPLTGGFFLFHRPRTGGDHPVDRVPDPSVLSGWGGSRRPDGHSGRGVSPV